MRPADYDIPLLPGELARSEVTPNLRCRQCGYNLRGLRADGHCPECGLAVWQSIVRETDHEASRMPRLNDPKGVGNGLLSLMIILLVVAMMIAIGPVLRQLRIWGVDLPPTLAIASSPMMTYLTGVVALAGLWSVWKLSPRSRGESPTGWRDIRLVALGLAGWSAMFILLGGVFDDELLVEIRRSALLVSHAFAASIFLGLRGVFKTIGERSREYRRSREGRQNLGVMVLALAGVASSDAIHLMHEAGMLGENAVLVGAIVQWVCSFLLMLGLVYLVGNAWIIRQSIARPPRSLDELLMPDVPPDVHLFGVEEEPGEAAIES